MGEDDWDRLGEEDDFNGLEGEDEFATEDYGEDMFAEDSLEAEEAEESVASQLGAMLGAEDEDEFFGKLLGGIKSPAKKAAPFVGKLARGAGPILSMIPHPDLGVDDQVVEEVGAADGVDVLVGLGTEFVLDLAPDVVALLLDRTRRGTGVVEIEVDLGVRRHAELGEQVIDHCGAVGVQDLAFDGADPWMLQRGVHLGRRLGHALVNHRLHALEHALGAKRAHVLHLVGENGVLERDVRHHQRTRLALVGRVLDCRRAACGGLDEIEAVSLTPSWRASSRLLVTRIHTTAPKVKPWSDSDRLFRLIVQPEEGFMGSSKLPMRSPKIRTRLQSQIAKSNEDALAAFVSKKAEVDAILTRLQALSDDHFNYSPDEIIWGDVGTLEHYSELLRRITDSAFNEGEHAA